MDDLFTEDDFYTVTPAADSYSVADGYGKTQLVVSDKALADELCAALNLALARGILLGMTSLLTPEQVAEAGVV